MLYYVFIKFGFRFGTYVIVTRHGCVIRYFINSMFGGNGSVCSVFWFVSCKGVVCVLIFFCQAYFLFLISGYY